MTETKIALMIVIAMSAVTVAADILIKKAADLNQLLSVYFVAGAIVYGLPSFGWFHALRSLNLATLGGVYSLSTVLMLVLSGVIFFGEQLRPVEIVVVCVSILSIVALWRFL